MVSAAVSEAASELPEFGPCRILELLGQGGMGLVHRALDTRNDRVIALKRLPVSVTEQDYRARFRRGNHARSPDRPAPRSP
jgi:hypothetical protein